MNKKGRKKLQKKLAQEAIYTYFDALTDLDRSLRDTYESKYISQIIKLQTSFTIKLKREEKLKICKKCLTYQTSKTQLIRFNSELKTKEFICKKCGDIRRFKYK
ncbi:MAG: hypothetical protein LAT82_04210 [Nanoarchaeota archaeon]|nr:hypothetical protein [Nanoarchaeota archaeon]